MSPVREATATGTTSDAVVTRDGLLARFGLDAAADDQEVETTYDRIGDFLDQAPSEIRGWADRRQQEADRIFSLLTGPESQLVPPPERRLRPPSWHRPPRRRAARPTAS